MSEIVTRLEETVKELKEEIELLTKLSEEAAETLENLSLKVTELVNKK